MAENNNSTIKTTVELDVTNVQQQIVKLNATASDSNEELTDRIEAKNKAVKLGNQLSKKAINDLEREIKGLDGVAGSEKKVLGLTKKLNTARLKQTKETVKNEKATRKLSDAYEDSQDTVKGLDDATGGLLGKMRAFVANPIGLVVIALVSAFQFFSKAISRSKGATESFNKIGAKLSGVLNGIMAVVVPLVEWVGEKLVAAFENPGKAIKDLGDAIKENLINRVKSFLIFGEAFAALMEGDIEKATEKGREAVLQFGTGIEDVEKKISKFAENAQKDFDKTAAATEKLANAERSLVENRIALEKLQLSSLKAAEDERAIRDDISKSIEERIAANVRLGKILDEQSQKELEIAQQNLEFAKLKKISDGDNIESLEAIGEAEVKLLEIQERIGGQRSEQLVNEQSLLKEGADLQASIKEQQFAQELVEIEARKKRGEETLADELDVIERRRLAMLDNKTLEVEGIRLINETAKAEAAAVEEADRELQEQKRLTDVEAQNSIDEQELERRRALGENVLTDELALLERKFEQDVSASNLTAKQIEDITKEHGIAKGKIIDAEVKARKEAEKAVLDLALNGAAEAFGIAQEVAVAKMIMNAPEAIAGSFKNAAQVYAPPLSFAMGALGAATTVIPIVKGLNDIKNTRFSGSKGGSSGGSIAMPSLSGGAGGGADLLGSALANSSSNLGNDSGLSSQATSDASNNVAGGVSNNIVFSEAKYGDFKNQVAFVEEKTTIS